MRSYGGLILLAVVIVAAVLLARAFGLFELSDRVQLAAAIHGVREISGIGVWFVLVYAITSALGLPATPLTLVGGAIFGTAAGSALNWMGASLGANGAYWLARVLGSQGVRRLLGKHAGKLDTFSGGQGFSTVLRLRLIPVVPFNVLNFAAGLSGIAPRSYAVATAIGIVPGTIIYTFFADSLVAGVDGAQSHALVRMLIAGALLTALSFVPAIVRRVSRGQGNER